MAPTNDCVVMKSCQCISYPILSFTQVAQTFSRCPYIRVEQDIKGIRQDTRLFLEVRSYVVSKNDNSREKGASKVSICSLLISMCNCSRSFRPFHLVLWVRKRAQDAKAKRNRHERLFMWFWSNNKKHTITRNKFWPNRNLQNRHSVIGKQITNLSVGCAHFQREHRS